MSDVTPEHLFDEAKNNEACQLQKEFSSMTATEILAKTLAMKLIAQGHPEAGVTVEPPYPDSVSLDIGENPEVAVQNNTWSGSISHGGQPLLSIVVRPQVLPGRWDKIITPAHACDPGKLNS